MRRYKYLIFLVLLAVVFTGCSVSVSTTGDVGGWVFVPKGSSALSAESAEVELLFLDQATIPYGYVPAVDVKVQVAGRSGQTDINGRFYLQNVTSGDHTLIASGGPLRFEIRKTVQVRAGSVTWFGDYGKPPIFGGLGHYIVIGIDNYSYEGDFLPGPLDDAHLFFDTFVGENRLAVRGDLLINEDATKDSISLAIEQAIIEASDTEAVGHHYLVIYFSGNSDKLGFLSPYDDDLEGFYKAITDKELEEWVRPFPGDVTVIIDGEGAAGLADGEPFWPFALGTRKKYTVLAGSRKEDPVNYVPDYGNSLFTHYLVKAVTYPYPANKDGDRDITASEIYAYVWGEMDRENRNLPPAYWQEPYIWRGYYADTVIFRY